MRGFRFLLAALVALAASGCMWNAPDEVPDRGVFRWQASAPAPTTAQRPLQKPYVLQYTPPPARAVAAAPPSAPARSIAAAPPRQQPETAPYAAVPVSYAEALPYQ